MNDLHIIRRIRNQFANDIAFKDFNVEIIKTLSKDLSIAKTYQINANDNPSMLGIYSESLALATSVIWQSSVNDIITPRNRFIRSVELLAAFLLFEDHLSNSVGKCPKF
jgi:hypothetical protein